MEGLLGICEVYLDEVVKLVFSFSEESKGFEVIGTVPGRSLDEDVQISLDQRCEQLLREILEKYNVPVMIISEHGEYKVKDSIKYYCAVDPFDGSGLYRRGIRREWYSVLTFFDLKNNPIAGGCVDILEETIYLADCSQKIVLKKSLETSEIEEIIMPKKTTLDSSTIFSAYLMSPIYLFPWVKKMAKLEKRFPSFIWPNGGACIYSQIAQGMVHAYIMFDEPRSEIDPGLAFAQAAGFPVVSVNPDGKYEDYKFLPGKQTERVPWFIAANSKKLLRAILKEMK